MFERKLHLQAIYDEIHRAIEARVGRFLIGDRLNLAAPTVGTLPPTAGGTGGTSGVTIRGATDYDNTSAPADGQTVTWSAASGKFHPVTPTGGGGGGGSISTGTLASRPAAGTAGRLYLPTDDVYLYEDNGSAWGAWGPVYPLTPPPTIANWTWVNQGGAVATQVGASLNLSLSGDAGTQMRGLFRTLPAAPYTVTAIFRYVTTLASSNTIALDAGVAWRQSSTGALVMYSIEFFNQTATFLARKFSNPTTFSADYINTPAESFHRDTLLIWRLTDDGANRLMQISADGQVWVTLHSVGRTDFLTADQAGIMVRALSGAVSLTLLSWTVA